RRHTRFSRDWSSDVCSSDLKLSSGAHFGSRLVFDRQGYLFIALGENNQRSTSQDLDKLQGKIVRLHADGRVPADNPFVDNSQAKIGRASCRERVQTLGVSRS